MSDNDWCSGGSGICTQLLGDEGKAMQRFAWELGGAAAPDLCARIHQIGVLYSYLCMKFLYRNEFPVFL